MIRFDRRVRYLSNMKVQIKRLDILVNVDEDIDLPEPRKED